jgi:hypothetical protein
MKHKPSVVFGGLGIVLIGGYVGVGAESVGPLLIGAVLVLAGIIIAAAGQGDG